MTTKHQDQPSAGDVVTVNRTNGQLFYVHEVSFGNPTDPEHQGYVVLFPFFERFKEGQRDIHVCFVEPLSWLSRLVKVPAHCLSRDEEDELLEIKHPELVFEHVRGSIEDYIEL